ncbi:DUF6297 family protein [Nocardioides nitrophenolicus]|uniref:DUF6297 family protein n=1 Tax=Nocardioides nitrophenolicus TaxID=60489 RepID=UPI00195EF6E8|nr:DUF6297 family protein [Nocardioides nitrophenolicus]MBM7518728.1 hypothetical protein [Nocardioides nitrophenolicus]
MRRTEAGELRADIRFWRRSRRTLSLGEALQDLYIGVFAVLMLGSMLVSVLVNLSDVGDRACVASDCAAARSLLPWLVVGTLLALLWSLARMVGPVAVGPGVAAWLLPSPVDRGDLLRGRARGTALLAAALVAPVAAGAATLAGFGVAPLVVFTVGAAGLASYGVGALTAAQAAARSRHPALLLGPVSLLAVGVGLATIAASRAPVVSVSPAVRWAGLVATGLVWVGVLVGLVRARVLTARLRRRDVAPGGVLVPGLGGALATLDLALMFDVLVAHASSRRGALRPRRGGPAGLAALAWRDLVRLRRQPGRLVLLAGSLLVPYAVATVGGRVVVVLVEVLVCFVLVVPFLVALRVLTRSAGMSRMFPTPLGPTRAAAVVVPGALLVVHGLLSAPALHRTLTAPASDLALLGVASGVAGLAAGVRWVTGRPPDYGRPLVSTPAGGVPTNLYGSVLRGFDIAVLTALPMLFAPTGGGATVSLAVSVGVIGYLCSRGAT